MKNQTFFSMLFLAIFFLGFYSSCSKDEAETTDCSNFSVIDGEITVNGAKQRLSIAQFIAQSDFYGFNLAGISDDCNEQKLLNINIMTLAGAKLSGTYQITEDVFATPGASGSFVVQKISPISQSSVELKSGTVKITELGVKKYTIDINATDITGGKTTLTITHQF